MAVACRCSGPMVVHGDWIGSELPNGSVKLTSAMFGGDGLN